MADDSKNFRVAAAFTFNMAKIKTSLFNFGLILLFTAFLPTTHCFARAGFSEWSYATPIPGMEIGCNDSMPQDEKCVVLYEDDRIVIGDIISYFFTSNSIYGVTRKNQWFSISSSDRQLNIFNSREDASDTFSAPLLKIKIYYLMRIFLLILATLCCYLYLPSRYSQYARQMISSIIGVGILFSLEGFLMGGVKPLELFVSFFATIFCLLILAGIFPILNMIIPAIQKMCGKVISPERSQKLNFAIGGLVLAIAMMLLGSYLGFSNPYLTVVGQPILFM